MVVIQEAFDALREFGPEHGIDRFASSIDPAWIEEALDATNKASVRRRKLPMDQVLWLVLGMALFRDRSIVDVVDHLDLVIKKKSKLAKSAVTKARYRLGQQPVQWLFSRVVKEWIDSTGADDYRGRSVWGLDGSCLRVPDSDENFEHFGKPGGPEGSNDAGYPQARIVTLMNLKNRLLKDINIGSYNTSEHALASSLWALSGT